MVILRPRCGNTGRAEGKMRHEILRSLLFGCAVSALITAATPAPGPRRTRRQPNFGDAGERDGAAGADRQPGREQPGASPGPGLDAPLT